MPQLQINTTNDGLGQQQNSKSHKRHKSGYDGAADPNNGSGGGNPNGNSKVDQMHARTMSGPSSSQQKVTNITNIIYNFNYGTPQAQAASNGQQ